MQTTKDPQSAAAVRLKESVAFRQRLDHIVVLDTLSPMPALRLPLTAGTALYGLREHGVDAADVRSVKLAAKLAQYGFMEDSRPEPAIARRVAKGSLYLPNPDRLAHALARAAQHIAPNVLTRGLALLAGLAACALLYRLWSWAVLWTAPAFSPVGLAIYFLLCLPLHELAHAAACRYAGVAVNGMGIQYQRRLFPTPFVNTNNMVLVESKRRRAAICLAGPLFDLLLAGTAALGSLGAWPGADVCATLCVCALFFGVFNLNPLRVSDGSNALRELHTDAQGRMRPLSPGWRRAALAGFLALLLMVLGSFIPAVLGYAQRWSV